MRALKAIVIGMGALIVVVVVCAAACGRAQARRPASGQHDCVSRRAASCGSVGGAAGAARRAARRPARRTRLLWARAVRRKA